MPFDFSLKSDLSLYEVAHQIVEFQGEDSFQPSPTRWNSAAPVGPTLFSHGGLLLRANDSTPLSVALKFAWSREVGAPERANRHICNLELGQWAQLICNGRTSTSGTVATGWVYRQWSLNVAFVDQLNVDIFLKEPPVQVCKMLGDLR